MSGIVNVGVVLGQVHYGVDETDPTTDVQFLILLDNFASKHRACKSEISFSSLPQSCRKDF